MTKICMAGVTGWTGRAVAAGILDAGDLELTGALARKTAGLDVGDALERAPTGVTITADVGEALAGAEVLIDYTHPEAVKEHTRAAIGRGISVVVGTSGLTAADYAEIDEDARAAGVGVLAAGNFSLTAALVQHFALIAARHIGHFEVIDYASAAKPDAPSGTAREMAERLGEVCQPALGHPLEKVSGTPQARGGRINGVQVHSLRLPSYVGSVEAVFAVPGARMSLRHDAGETAEPYVEGTLAAARKVREVKGLVRGLDRLLFG
ncbi:4-hydroxy-tetrahydrodipicolinate reductase [Pelagibius sp. CAU 1746]|uniref:4-hydroxy-tetrahydrodipicolinate reductase n=1 Tax=Pelagibius sp. CAU 1746 TaxID=3140370 RepID=UPI00325B5FBA